MQTVTKEFQAAAGKASFIRKMFEKGIELKKEFGEDKVCDFSLGNPDLPPPDAAREALHKIADEAMMPFGLGYCPNAGVPFVRDAIAKYLSSQQDVALRGKDVIMTVGAASALVCFFRATVEAGDEIIVPSPYFVEYGNYCGHFGGVLRPVDTNEDFTLNLETIKSAITPKTRAILVNSPNNPTGTVYSLEELKALAKIVDEENEKRGDNFRPLYLLSDEPYRAFAYDGAVVPPVLPLSPFVVVLGSFSKTLSMAGERIGYLALNPELTKIDGGTLLQTLILVNRTLGYVNAPIIGQKLAAAICSETVDLETYKRRHDLMAKVLSDAGIEFVMPRGAFYFFPKAPGGDDKRFVDELLKERILAVPGSGFGRAGHIRLSCAVEEVVIERSAEGFKRAADRCRNEELDMTDIKTPPQNTEAERAVLGCILLDARGRNGDRIMDLCLTEGVSADTFFDPRNKLIYQTMLDMNRTSKPLDPLTLMEELRVKERIETVGGVGYVESLLDQVQTTANAEYYVSIVKGKQIRRTLIDRATRVIEKSYDEGEYPDPLTVLGEAEKDFLAIKTHGDQTLLWSEAVEESFKRIDRMFSSNGTTFEGLSTGLKHLDEKLQGLKPSEMIVIAARPSVGKTSLAMNIAESAALGQMTTLKGTGYPPVAVDGGKQHPVLIFSLEMPVEALTKRMVSGRAHINMWRLNRNLCARAEKEQMNQNLFQAVSELKGAPIYVDDAAGLDIMDLRARARRMKKAHGIELIVIDYLQLCKCSEKAKQGRQLEVSEISQQIKAMAKELKIPVIVLSQLSRANEQRGDKYEKPKLSDLRDSGAIEQDADVVFLLRRPSRNAQDPESDDEALAIIDVAKNRNGEIGEVRVNFIREYTRFEDRPLPAGEEPEGFQSSEPHFEREDFVQDPLG